MGCAGSNSKCTAAMDDEAKCNKMAARAGCEWRTGADADCTPDVVEPTGCCFGANSRCDTDDEAKCNRFAARAGCEWRTGADANCASNEQERVFSVLDTVDVPMDTSVPLSTILLLAVAVLA